MNLSPAKRDLLQRLLREKGIGPSAPTPAKIAPRKPGARIPLYPNQEGLWFVDQLHPGLATHNVPGTVRLVGRLDVPALTRTLDEIRCRHEALRTTYRAGTDGVPEQIVQPYEPTALPVEDLTNLPAADRRPRARAIAAEAAATAFDLGTGPLMRTRLLRLGPTEHVLLLNFHHSAADGWAMGIFSRELAALYAAFTQGRASPLPALPAQYGDFALWHAAREQSPWLDTELAFWRDLLTGPVADLALPADRPRPADQTYRGAHETLTVDRGRVDRLRAFAQSHRASLYHVLQAAFAITLYRYGRQTDLCVGSTYANRNEPALEKMMGFCANTLPLRYDLSGAPSFAGLLGRIRDLNLRVHEHHELPFTTLVKALKPERGLGQRPYFDVVFDYLTPDHNPALYGYGLSSTVSEVLELPGLSVHPMDVEGGVARYDIAVFLWDMPEGLHGTAEYATDRFDRSTIVRLFTTFQRALDLGLERPADSIDQIADVLAALDDSEEARDRTARKQSMREKLRRKMRQKTRDTKRQSADGNE